MPQSQTVDIVPILAGTLGGFTILLALAMAIGYVNFKRNQKNKVMSPEDLARLAKSGKFSPLVTAMPVNTSSFNNENVLAARTQPKRIAPSVRMTSMASQAQQAPDLFRPTVPLIAIYDFFGERDDELQAPVGTRLFGIEQQDGWWLAKMVNGVIGLIPVAYTERDAEAPAVYNQGKGYLNPDF